MKNQNHLPRYLTEAMAAEMLSLAPETLRNWRGVEGKGPGWSKLPGGDIRYSQAELIRLGRGLPAPAGQAGPVRFPGTGQALNGE